MMLIPLLISPVKREMAAVFRSAALLAIVLLLAWAPWGGGERAPSCDRACRHAPTCPCAWIFFSSRFPMRRSIYISPLEGEHADCELLPTRNVCGGKLHCICDNKVLVFFSCKQVKLLNTFLSSLQTLVSTSSCKVAPVVSTIQ